MLNILSKSFKISFKILFLLKNFSLNKNEEKGASEYLKNNINRLAEDHKRAFDIGKKLETLSFVRKVEDVESNIVIFEIDHKIESQKFLDELNKKGISIISMGDNKLRVVTHIDYTEDQHQFFLSLLDKLNI